MPSFRFLIPGNRQRQRQRDRQPFQPSKNKTNVAARTLAGKRLPPTSVAPNACQHGRIFRILQFGLLQAKTQKKCGFSLSPHERIRDGPNTTTTIIFQKSFASDAIPKRHSMAHQMKNLGGFSVLHCVEGAFGASSGGTPQMKNGPPRDELKNGRVPWRF